MNTELHRRVDICLKLGKKVQQIIHYKKVERNTNVTEPENTFCELINTHL